MVRFSAVILAILITFAACSRGGNPIFPRTYGGTDGTETPGVLDTDPPYEAITDEFNGSEVWGAVELTWDPGNAELSVVSRSPEIALRHFRVSYFLTPPRCEDCIQITLTGNDASLGTGQFDVTLNNPTNLWGYDVRGVLQIDKADNLTLLNPDGYTSVFENTSYVYPAPFKTYAKFDNQHRFSPGSSYTEDFELKTDPGTYPVTFSLLVTAGHPDAAGDVSVIRNFRQFGQLMNGGGAAFISFDIEDLQNDISGVLLNTGVLGSGDLWLLPGNNTWDATLINTSAVPGIYELKIDAHSPNPQNAVTSHYYRAVVFHDLPGYRAELLTLVNADRAANGIGSLVVDEALNTVAQFHGQDMADKVFFDHTNLAGWTPWERMNYYGISYSRAGENIAVGHDNPAQVEQAWMDSPGHRANILNKLFNKIGFGIVPTEAGDPYSPGYYWVQVFSN